MCLLRIMLIFFFNDTATTEIYTLSLHDALPISKIDPLPHPPRIDPELQPGPQGCRDGARRAGAVGSGVGDRGWQHGRLGRGVRAAGAQRSAAEIGRASCRERV